MIIKFKKWFDELAENAILVKKAKASAKGDESKWGKEIWRSSEKNKQIKMKFRDEGAKLGLRSRPSYVTGAGEWLYDFIWREFDHSGNLIGVKLAMEIEMSDMNLKGIRYDFNKLLQSDAEYKVMVFQLKEEAEVNEALDNLHMAFMSYQAKAPAHYLLAGWCTRKQKFIFHDFL
ncbi:hypothetical protein GZ77_05315 [Endozoicomonas montiporae]|uniref:Uncharacterized protein n=2 Tax=Endozoicomonas montiporae TaxID=1027273 RepID=A0A081NBU8_9GAMM|nr:hypothetical protein [Endozoicomonas montiporae]AMO56232.1 hypothetical protein EZMO1_2115 [Endozoicomonas montiporae CL-33]KEQ15921.1 hypothetical protein GZ77_05315 [Endozoicomonas montiporae]